MISALKKLITTSRENGSVPLTHSPSNVVRYQAQNQLEKNIEPLWRKISHSYRYGSAAPNPDRLIEIDPGNLNYLLCPHFWDSVSRYTTHVREGCWDRNYTDEEVVISGRFEGVTGPSLVNFDNFRLYTSAKSHFQRGVPWKDTKVYKSMVENIHMYREYEKYDSEVSVERTLSTLDSLYAEIKQHGYLMQEEIRDIPRENPFTSSVLDPPRYHEVAINIGRDGTLIFDDGKHRAVVAKVLGLSSIPVRVLVRHAEWQTLRNEVSDAESISDLSDQARQRLDHPDMVDVRPVHLSQSP